MSLVHETSYTGRPVPVEAVALDLDGVIVHDNKLVPGAIEAIRAVRDKNIPIFPVTSRDFLRCLWLIDQIEFRDPGVFSGGAAIAEFTPKKQVVWEKPIRQDVAYRLTAALLPYSTVINTGNGQTKVTERDPLEDIKGPCFGVWAEFSEKHVEETELILQQFSQDTDSPLEYHYNHGTVDTDIRGVHVTAAGANKYTTTRQVLERLDVNPAHALAVADGSNDIPLFRAVGTGVAMGNASEDLKAIATHQVGDVLAGGFAEAIQKFVLGPGVSYDYL